MTITSHQFALPPGTLLMEYRVSGLLGAGAFGITYLARDTHLDKDVAIKEYLPSAFAARAADGSIVPITPQQEQDYRWGLDRFGQEARTLARFSHPHIVRVYRYFEANNTGYMVMDYEGGQSLKAFVAAHPAPSETRLKALIAPLLDGLEKVHASGFLHRDIKPDNIFLRQDAGPVLIDFGSARHAAVDSAQALTTIVSPGYAPFEQYTTSKKQGPWSDIYSLGGVLYFLMTGRSPPDAITRMKADTLGDGLQQARGLYSPAFVDAIAWSLALEEGARPHNVAMWREALLGAPAGTAEVSSSGQQTVRVEPWVSALRLESDAIATVRLEDTEPTIVPLDASSDAGSPVGARTQPPVGRNWVFGQLLLITITIVLGEMLGKLPAFQEAQVMEGRLSAASLVQLLSAGGAILFLWLLGRAVSVRLRRGPRAVLHELLMPAVTMLSLALGYAVVLRLLGPVLDETQASICGWSLLLGACGCAIWLCMAVLSHAEPVRTLLHEYRHATARTGDQGGSA